MAFFFPVHNSIACNNFTKPVLETFSLICSLCKNEGYCWARNEALAEMRKVSKATITRHIQKLVAAGLFVWQMIGRERHLTPVASTKMTRVCVESAPDTRQTHAGAAKSQTLETKETFRENTQQTATTLESSPDSSADSVVVVSSAKACPEGEPNAESAGQGRGESPGAGRKVPSAIAAPEFKPEAKPEAAPVAELEIVRGLCDYGVYRPLVEQCAAKIPDYCCRLLAAASRLLIGAKEPPRLLAKALRAGLNGEAWKLPEPI